MQNTCSRTTRWLVCAAALMWLAAGVCTAQSADGGERILIFLVRHGETVAADESDEPRNPHLSQRGRLRANDLSHQLKDAKIRRVLSTDLYRTRETAKPIAERLELTVDIYDQANLQGLAEDLLSRPGVSLVSGHSNTTPELVRLLGGDPGTEIDHRWEYDRLYAISVVGGRVETILLRYGEASVPLDE